MKDRRSLVRYTLEVPVRVEILKESGEREILQLQSKDISSAGAFFYSSRSLPEGKLSMEIVLNVNTLKQIIGEHGDVRVKLSGTVVRVDPEGVAVRFDKKYRIDTISE